MKFQRTFLVLSLALLASTLTTIAGAQTMPSNKTYQQMNAAGRSAYVAGEARNIARRMSGSEYKFTLAFEAEIQKSVDFYAGRIGNNGGDVIGKSDARLVLERGQTVAATLIKTFKARNVSPLIGLYIPFIESEYTNIETPNTVGAIGMFQFLPQTGKRFGLTAQELLDVEKSADAAARYINGNLKLFKDDAMKETLALLAYNRGEGSTQRDLQAFVNNQNRECSICALTAAREQLDATFQSENVHYVPRFFAAAIVGENPNAFGLDMQPLSSYEGKQ